MMIIIGGRRDRFWWRLEVAVLVVTVLVLVVLCHVPTMASSVRETKATFSTSSPSSSQSFISSAVRHSDTKQARPSVAALPRAVISTNQHGGHSQSYTFVAPIPTVTAPPEHDPSPHSTARSAALVDSASAPSSIVDSAALHRQPPSLLPSLLTRCQSTLRSTFLPAGFPSRTPPGYVAYALWSSLQDTSTQLRSVLATQRILQGIGVGRPGATAVSAVLQFMIRDGCGMAASLLVTALAASQFRANLKPWRWLADVLVDVGITLEVAAVQMPTPALFLLFISLGNACKAICGVAAGACGGAIHLYWAQGGSDITDIQAKFGAQNTVTGSVGLVGAALMAQSVSKWQVRNVWLLYAGLTALHLYANRQCLRLIAFDSFNRVRLRMVVAEYFQRYRRDQDHPPARDQARPDSPQPATTTTTTTTLVPTDDTEFTDPSTPSLLSSLPTPQEIAKKEPLFFLPRAFLNQKQRQLTTIPIHFGVSFNDFAKHSGLDEDSLQNMLAASSEQSLYWIAIGHRPARIQGPEPRRRPRHSKPSIYVALASNATAAVQTKAFFHALLLVQHLNERGDTNQSLSSLSSSLSPLEDMRRVEQATQDELENHHLWEDFSARCQRAGWDITQSDFGSLGYEIAIE